MSASESDEKPREKDKKRKKEKSVKSEDRKNSSSKSERRKRSKSRSRERRKKSGSRERERHGGSNRGDRKVRSRSRSRSRPKPGRAKFSNTGSIDPASKEKADMLAQRVVANPIPAPERRVYVGGLAYDLLEEHIKVPFSSFGQIVMVDMPREPGTNRSKGFCFVEYTTKEAAEHALISMNGFTLGGRAIKVGRSTPVGGMSSFAMPPASLMALRVQQIREQAMTAMRVAEKQPMPEPVEETQIVKKAKPDPAVLAQAKAALAKKIYVGQIVETLSSEHIRSIFAPFGNIVSLRLSTAGAKEGEHKGYGFIEYETELEANEAARLMNGFELCGKNLKVSKATA